VAQLRAGLSLNQNLPGYVVMLDPRGGPIQRRSELVERLHAGGLQGTVFRAGGQPILNLDSASGLTAPMQRDLITTANGAECRASGEASGLF